MSQINPVTPPKSRKPDSRPERTREEFRTALIRLLGKCDFEDIRVREIAGEAGAGYATFFRHYRDKADLLDDVIQQFLISIQKPTVLLLESEKGLSAATTICEFIDDNRALATARGGQ